MRELLELPLTGDLSKGLIIRNYKKISLKKHPDKGGDAAEFNKFADAYKQLLAIQDEEDIKNSTTIIDYEVILERGNSSVGLGIAVSDDKIRNAIVITNLLEGIIVRGMSIEAQGEIRIGDALIAIDRDDCTEWPISRIKARLDSFRVPEGSRVHLVMARRVPMSTSTTAIDKQPMNPHTHTHTHTHPHDDENSTLNSPGKHSVDSPVSPAVHIKTPTPLHTDSASPHFNPSPETNLPPSSPKVSIDHVEININHQENLKFKYEQEISNLKKESIDLQNEINSRILSEEKWKNKSIELNHSLEKADYDIQNLYSLQNVIY
jgi:hypothetical protein